MSFNDPIAELLTKIRNALMAKHRYVDISLSIMKKNLLEILKDEGFITNYLVDTEKKQMRVFLKYSQRQPVIRGLKRVSSPGLRKYANHKTLPKVLNGIGIAVLSTSLGLLTDQVAREKGVGGEVLCYIW